LDWFLEIIERMWPQPSALLPDEAVSLPKTETAQQPLRYQPIFRQVIDSLSGEDIASHIPFRKLIKAIGFKFATHPGFRWLYRYRSLGKKILGG
jgi:hypothetical protein